MPKSQYEAVPQDGAKYYGIGHANATGDDVILSVRNNAVARAIQLVTGDGDGLTFSRTRDGGAVCVAVLNGGRVQKWYAASSDELEEVLEGLCEACKPVG